jgi:hypothetical protein
VSLSLRDELRIVLCRDQVQLVRIGRELTLQGRQDQVLDKKIYPYDADAVPRFDNVVRVLELALSELPKKPAHAQVILSNHFVRYTMVPWSDKLSNETEELAYAKHCFNQLYGATAQPWELRLHQDFAGSPQLASAIDGELLQALRAVFVRAQVKLKSVQPQLMTAYNNCQEQLRNQNAWFVLFNQGNLCLGLVQQGHWNSVRTLKVGSDWLARLPEILDREAYLSELNTTSDRIFLWAPEQSAAVLPQSTQWKISLVAPVIRPSFLHEYDERFAMALCG